MKKSIWLLVCMVVSLTSRAQIGYQVSLLNTATGEPRANVTVNAAVTITNSKGETIYSGTHSATSNDFGVLSLTVGNADTFKNVDFGKLPFFIQVSVDGRMIGRSQILNVPVAEAAKKVAPAITKLNTSFKLGGGGDSYLMVDLNITDGKGTCKVTEYSWFGSGDYRPTEEFTGLCEVEGNIIYAHLSNGLLYILRYYNGKIYSTLEW